MKNFQIYVGKSNVLYGMKPYKMEVVKANNNSQAVDNYCKIAEVDKSWKPEIFAAEVKEM